LKLAGVKGIHRTIVLDPNPAGYEASGSPLLNPGTTFVDGAIVAPSLLDTVPAFGRFGYTINQRVAFIRNRGIDPVDLLEPNVEHLLPPAPFFDPAPFEDNKGMRYPSSVALDERIFTQWREGRYKAQTATLASFFYQLSVVSGGVFVQPPSASFDGPIVARSFPFTPKLDFRAESLVRILSINPSISEDADGKISFGFENYADNARCFDLTDCPLPKIERYLNHLFKS